MIQTHKLSGDVVKRQKQICRDIQKSCLHDEIRKYYHQAWKTLDYQHSKFALIALNPHTPPDILHELFDLSKDQSEKHNYFNDLVQNQSLPKEILEQIWAFRCQEVHLKIDWELVRLIAVHSNCPGWIKQEAFAEPENLSSFW